ncbi:nucleotidyltransferase domain-containing protein [Candidatus Woesearchaeota archaeon]|nr:nucleotidyltransferase domain-containing protein [Candidatus Woesearchaeota archaeon]
MNSQNIIFAYLYDFISMLLERKEVISNLDMIILFGSMARGDFDDKSDIDLFIEIKNLSHKNTFEKAVKEVISNFDIKSEKTWGLKKKYFPIKPIIGRLNEPEWEELHSEIISTGIVIYGKYEKNPSDLQHDALVSYSLNKIMQNKKMNFLRKMYGYKNKKGKMIYVQKGMAEELGAVKVTVNQIKVRVNNLKKVLDILKEFKIPYTVKEIWCK